MRRWPPPWRPGLRWNLSTGRWEGNEDSGICLMDRLEEERDDHEVLINRMVLRELMEGLDKEQREIILRRYFLQSDTDQNCRGSGISQVQVSRLEKRILKEMRRRFEG